MNSHSSEAWELPPPAFGGEGSNNKNGAAGAYLGLFRPPGNAGAEMGFHMCVAVIPSGEEARLGDIVTEEVLDAPASLRPAGVHPDKEVCLSTGRAPPFIFRGRGSHSRASCITSWEVVAIIYVVLCRTVAPTLVCCVLLDAKQCRSNDRVDSCRPGCIALPSAQKGWVLHRIPLVEAEQQALACSLATG